MNASAGKTEISAQQLVQLGADSEQLQLVFVGAVQLRFVEPWLLFWLLYVPHARHVLSDQQLEKTIKIS